MIKNKKLAAIATGACACLMASALVLSACSGATKSTVKQGSNNDGSKGASSTYSTDNGKYSSAANVAVAYGEVPDSLMNSGYTDDTVKKFCEQETSLMPLSDMGKSSSDIANAAATYEKSHSVLKPLIEPVKACDKFWAHGECGTNVGSDIAYEGDETLAEVQALYAKAGGQSTITAATYVRPNFSYTFKEAYGTHAAQETYKTSVVMDGLYFICINDQWYLFDSNL